MQHSIILKNLSIIGSTLRPAILPKTKGSGIMVSDFVEEYGGYLKLSPEELDHAKSK